MNVGVLETKNRLSELIEAARRGEEVTITNRGEPVARLIGVGPETDEERRARALAALAEADRHVAAIFARTGKLGCWEENKRLRDEGRP